MLLEVAAGFKVVSDKGFDSDKLRRELEALGASHRFPSKVNTKQEPRLNKRSTVSSISGELLLSAQTLGLNEHVT